VKVTLFEFRKDMKKTTRIPAYLPTLIVKNLKTTLNMIFSA
jgi:hypothetical protein